MRSALPAKLEAGRILHGRFGSTKALGPTGAFMIQGPCGTALKIISSAAYIDPKYPDWEHVSVSIDHRCPNWKEMCFIKDLFFEPEECCVQFHPAAAEYVNYHPFCLHIWRYVKAPFPTPPSILVGPK